MRRKFPISLADVKASGFLLLNGLNNPFNVIIMWISNLKEFGKAIFSLANNLLLELHFLRM